MPSPARRRSSPSATVANPVLCVSAASRLFWALAALLILWTSVLWAIV
ncbi:hypothetical protein [Candidatus Accumulibacter sp. ACC003]|nr:hypothetical protein [Candidatus Accumulibacter sp. ACC003]